MQPILVSLDQTIRNHFWTCPPPRFLNQLLIPMNLYLFAKNQAFSSLWSEDIVNLKILLSDWPTAFWCISQEIFPNQIFPNHGVSARILQIIQIFFIDHFQKKWITQFCNKFRKPYFRKIFGPFSSFLGKKFIFKKSGSITYNNTWASDTMLSFRKN